LALSFAAPLAWLVFRLVTSGIPVHATAFGGIWAEVESNLLLYAFMQAGAALTLVFSGFAVGWRDDRLREHYNRLLSQRRLLSIKSRQMERLSITDSLTGLSNRMRLQELLALEYKRALRYGTDLCVLLADVDHFKRINDTHGHLFGDYVLHELGQIFAGSRRETDHVGRTGGEEFCFVLTQTHPDDALRFADRLREIVAAFRFEYRGIRVAVRLSAGLASIREAGTTEGDDKGLRLLALADEALYEAKRSGRNLVLRWRPKPVSLPALA
jgi:diguanylate cyclase